MDNPRWAVFVEVPNFGWQTVRSESTYTETEVEARLFDLRERSPLHYQAINLMTGEEK